MALVARSERARALGLLARRSACLIAASGDFCGGVLLRVGKTGPDPGALRSLQSPSPKVMWIHIPVTRVVTQRSGTQLGTKKAHHYIAWLLLGTVLILATSSFLLLVAMASTCLHPNGDGLHLVASSYYILLYSSWSSKGKERAEVMRKSWFP